MTGLSDAPVFCSLGLLEASGFRVVVHSVAFLIRMVVLKATPRFSYGWTL